MIHIAPLAHFPYAEMLIRQAQQWSELEMLAEALGIQSEDLKAGLLASPLSMSEYARYIRARGRLPDA